MLLKPRESLSRADAFNIRMSTTASEATYSTPDSARFPVGVIASDRKLQTRLICALEAADIDVDACASDPRGLVADPQALDPLVVFHSGDAATLVESISEARSVLPEATLVVVWPATDEVNARRALRAGADGLVSEAELESTLAVTVRAVRSGLTCVPGRLRGRLDSESLSMREKQVLGMLVRGCTNAEIASRLYLAESTVKSHLSSAYSKLGVRSRQDAATMILDPGHGLGPGILAITPA